METPKKPHGGRPKGSGNRAKFDINAFVRKVEQASGRTLSELVASVLSDPKTKATMVLRLLSYRYGEPQAHVQVQETSRVEHSIRFVQSPRHLESEPQPDIATLAPEWRAKPAELPKPPEPPALPEKTNGTNGAHTGMRPSSNKGLF